MIFILPHNCAHFTQPVQTIPMLKSNYTARINHIRGLWLTSLSSILISFTVTQRGAATSRVIFGQMAPPAGWTHKALHLMPSGHCMQQTVLILPDKYTYVPTWHVSHFDLAHLHEGFTKASLLRMKKHSVIDTVKIYVRKHTQKKLFTVTRVIKRFWSVVKQAVLLVLKKNGKGKVVKAIKV